MAINQICQVIAVLSAFATLWLLAQKDFHIRKWGYVVGLIVQPVWIIIYTISQQWFLQSLVFVYGGLYLYGFYNHWIRKDKEGISK